MQFRECISRAHWPGEGAVPPEVDSPYTQRARLIIYPLPLNFEPSPEPIRSGPTDLLVGLRPVQRARLMPWVSFYKARLVSCSVCWRHVTGLRAALCSGRKWLVLNDLSKYWFLIIPLPCRSRHVAPNPCRTPVSGPFSCQICCLCFYSLPSSDGTAAYARQLHY
jgi:hypothetical protein